jgi:hypothetical protein
VIAGSRGAETWSARHLRVRRFRCDGQRSMQSIERVYARSLVESSLQKRGRSSFRVRKRAASPFPLPLPCLAAAVAAVADLVPTRGPLAPPAKLAAARRTDFHWLWLTGLSPGWLRP